MPTFSLTEDTISRLRTKFAEFQKARKQFHTLITRYVADYRQFNGTADERKEFLEEKYSRLAPSLSHLVADEKGILWNVSDIALLMGRTQQAISSTLMNLERSEGWCARLLALRQSAKSANGNKIFVYSEEIFDLLMDRYEEEYLQRFTKPRRGNQDNASDINELRRFWKYLHDMERHNELLALKEQQSDQPDIPAMSLKDIVALIWDKVFNIRIGTVSSLIFAVCFEVARRYFSVSLWVSLVPAVVVVVCVVLIHRDKVPDTLSDVGGGALLFLMLWISGALSLYKSKVPNASSNLILSPRLYGDEIYFDIATTDYAKAKEFLFRISPDVQFHSAGFLEQIDPEHNLHYPDTVIKHDVHSGVANIDVKYLDFMGKESSIWSFCFDIDLERIELCKKNVLDLKEAWLEAKKFDGKVYVQPHDYLLTNWGVFSIASITYGLNTTSPDTTVDFERLYDVFMKSAHIRGADEPLRSFILPADKYQCVSSYLTFKDGTSSDIRVSN